MTERAGPHMAGATVDTATGPARLGRKIEKCRTLLMNNSKKIIIKSLGLD